MTTVTLHLSKWMKKADWAGLPGKQHGSTPLYTGTRKSGIDKQSPQLQLLLYTWFKEYWRASQYSHKLLFWARLRGADRSPALPPKNTFLFRGLYFGSVKIHPNLS